MKNICILTLTCMVVFFGGSAGFAVSPSGSDRKTMTINPNPIGAARNLPDADNFVRPTTLSDDPSYYFEIYDESGQLWKRVPVNKAANENHTVQFPVEAGRQPGLLTYTVILWKARADEPPVKMAEVPYAFNILSPDNIIRAWIEPYNVPQGTEATLNIQANVAAEPDDVYRVEIDTGWKQSDPKKIAWLSKKKERELHPVQLPIDSTVKPGLFTPAVTLWKGKVIYKLTQDDMINFQGDLIGTRMGPHPIFAHLINQEFVSYNEFYSALSSAAISANFGSPFDEKKNVGAALSSVYASAGYAQKTVEEFTQKAQTVYSFHVVPSTNAENRLLTAWMEPHNIAPGTKATLHLQTSLESSATAAPALANTPDQKSAGPGNPVPFLVDIRRDLEPDDVLNVQVFEDTNPESGLYYYLPNAYNLSWDRDAGYRIRMSYLAAAEPGQAGNVLMDLDLDAGLDELALKTVKRVLQNYTARHHKRFSELVPFPFEGVPKASFSNDFADLYSVSKVVSHELSDFLAPFRVSWVTDSVTKENMQLALIDLGLNGTLNLASAGNTAKSIAVKINLADPGTFGELLWTRDQPVRNATPYPLRVKYLHALLLQANQREPVIYSWDLQKTIIPPRSAVELDAAAIPPWLTDAALRVWIEYGIAEKSEPYNVAVIDEITDGLSSLIQSDLMFQTLDVFSGTTIYTVAIQVRSRYFDPRSTRVQTKHITLSKDRETARVSGIYYGNWEYKGAEEQQPLFEYLFTVIMPDGSRHSSKWIPCNDPEVWLGTKQLQEMFGSLPGAAR